MSDVNQLATQLHSMLNAIHKISDEAWADAVPYLYYRRYKKGGTVLRAGDVVSDVSFLISGIARYFYTHHAGREYNKSFSMPGEVLSSISSIATGDPSPFSIDALVPCECLSISVADLFGLIERHHDWNILRVQLVEMLAIKKEKREADFLLYSPTERYVRFLREFGDVVSSIPNYHIASYLGVSEVALSRIRNRLGMTGVNIPSDESVQQSQMLADIK